MARFISTTFGKISGKHGTAVAAIRKDGLCILKEYRIAGNPNTVGQKNQRGKFGFAMKELNCMRHIFTITFGGQYGINKAVSLAMKMAVKGEFPDFEMDYSKLEISTGSVPGVSRVGFEQLNPDTIKIYWSKNIINVSQDDFVNLVLLHPNSKTAIHKQQIAKRTAESCEVAIPVTWNSGELHYWLYLTSAIGNSFSTSQFIL
jgi:hypothetical protein